VAALAARFRFPYLLLFTASLFVLDLLIPDFIPFADEVLLGLATALFASLRKPSGTSPVSGPSEPPAAEKNVTPPGGHRAGDG
jgi:hypothetical protein